MVSAALLIASLSPIPPVVRAWKKGARANYRVMETLGEDEGRVEVRYVVQVRITETGSALGTIKNRNFSLDGRRQSGINAKSFFTFGYGRIGPVQGTFDLGLGGGNPLIWAFSSPGWGGTGFKGKWEENGWHGNGLLGDAAGKSSVSLDSHFRPDAWPQHVKVEMSTPDGGYQAEIWKI
ncbi:hypothetical protein EON81_14335 [bacterium]|nr:MAG: hypothetical protein EON81_14335 [bacterium]